MGSIDYVQSREYAPQVSGGGLVRLGTTRVSVSGQGDLLVSNGYPGGRGGPVAQLDVLRPQAKVQPFVSGGYLFADGGPQWMIGGGVDVRVTRRAGVRLAVQDGFAPSTVLERGRPIRGVALHEPSIQCGFVYC